jgi:hypothetical protein
MKIIVVIIIIIIIIIITALTKHWNIFKSHHPQNTKP